MQVHTRCGDSESMSLVGAPELSALVKYGCRKQPVTHVQGIIQDYGAATTLQFHNNDHAAATGQYILTCSRDTTDTDTTEQSVLGSPDQQQRNISHSMHFYSNGSPYPFE